MRQRPLSLLARAHVSACLGALLFIYPRHLYIYTHTFVHSALYVHVTDLAVAGTVFVAGRCLWGGVAAQVLLSDNCECKITDFGLARAVDELDSQYVADAGYRPSNPTAYRWTSLEGLIHHVYTIQSDVWSFGVVLFEICSCGTVPYPEFQHLSADFISLLQNGGRLGVEAAWLAVMRDTMPRCWSALPKQRPTFSQLVKSFEDVLQENFDSHQLRAGRADAEVDAKALLLRGSTAATDAAVARAYSTFQPAPGQRTPDRTPSTSTAASYSRFGQQDATSSGSSDARGGGYILRKHSLEAASSSKHTYAMPTAQDGPHDPHANHAVVFLPGLPEGVLRPVRTDTAPVSAYSKFGSRNTAQPTQTDGLASAGYVSRGHSIEGTQAGAQEYPVPVSQRGFQGSPGRIVFLGGDHGVHGVHGDPLHQSTPARSQPEKNLGAAYDVLVADTADTADTAAAPSRAYDCLVVARVVAPVAVPMVARHDYDKLSGPSAALSEAVARQQQGGYDRMK